MPTTSYLPYPMLGLLAKLGNADTTPRGRRLATHSQRRRENIAWRRAHGLI